MKKLATALVCVLAACAARGDADPESGPIPRQDDGDRRSPAMHLGAFSVSLAVADLEASRAFYEKLGFAPAAGDPARNWLVLQNETATIGLFQGMFEKNILTFNPGWTRDQRTLADFTDVREIQRLLEERGLEIQTRADPSSTGPASLVLLDPDGNPILLDQHVPKPGE